MEQEFEEYVTFQVTAQDDTVVELAVVDEFEFEKKHYVVGAKIENDGISDEGVFIYQGMVQEEELKVEKITDAVQYQKIAQAYMDM